MSMLIASPLFTAYGAITQRQMRVLHPMISSFYISLFGLIVFTSVVLIRNDGYKFLYFFEASDWVYMICSGVLSGISLILTAKAFSYDTPSRLTIYTYLSSIFQFIFDLTILNTEFTGMQLVGIGIIFFANIIICVRTVKELTS